MVLECRAIAVCYQVPFMMISGRMLVKGVVVIIAMHQLSSNEAANYHMSYFCVRPCSSSFPYNIQCACLSTLHRSFHSCCW